MNLKKGRFYNVILKCEGIHSQTRAKDVDILKIDNNDVLVFYDCLCGVRKEIAGKVEKDYEDEIIFSVSEKKKYIIKELKK